MAFDCTVIAVDNHRSLFALRTGGDRYCVMRRLSGSRVVAGDVVRLPSTDLGVHVLEGGEGRVVALTVTSHLGVVAPN